MYSFSVVHEMFNAMVHCKSIEETGKSGMKIHIALQDRSNGYRAIFFSHIELEQSPFAFYFNKNFDIGDFGASILRIHTE